jgi:aminopeptidase N
VIHRNLDDMKRVLNQFVYQKAGWFLHMLRGVVGTDVFWNGIREYYRRYRNGSASTDDFRAVMEEASDKELGWFFQQWLNRSGIPKIDGRWRYDPTRKQVEIELAQSHQGEPFRLPIEVGIVAKAGELPRVERIDLSAQKAKFQFPADAAPASVTLDPSTWLLFEGELTPIH